MEKREKRVFLSILSFLTTFYILTGWVQEAQSQDKYPTRAIDLIIPFSPGGPADVWARITADFLRKKWGVPINAVNKPGGAGVPANLEVHQAAADGYTMLAENQSSCSFHEVSIKNLPYKTMDRTFVALLVISPSVFVSSPTLPLKNLKDLEVWVKKDPENCTWYSLGAGAADFLNRQFFKAIGVDIRKTKPVITTGGTTAYPLIASGQIKMGNGSAFAVSTAFRGGLVKPLAITGFRMPEVFPDLSTTIEQGYPTVNTVWWWGISGPPKLPSHIVNKWEEDLREISRDPELVLKIKNAGGIIRYQNSREFREYVRKEMEEAAELWGMK